MSEFLQQINLMHIQWLLPLDHDQLYSLIVILGVYCLLAICVEHFFYLMGVFGKRIRTGHHGSRPLLQLPQFLASFIQCYSGTCQVSDHTRGCPLHALNATWAWDVLGQASRCFSSCYLTNWTRVEMKERRQGEVC